MDKRLIIVDTEAAVALVSGATAVAAFVVVDLPGVFCEPPAVIGPAALESLVNSSSTKPKRKVIKINIDEITEYAKKIKRVCRVIQKKKTFTILSLSLQEIICDIRFVLLLKVMSTAAY